jgi:hypothetical protein
MKIILLLLLIIAYYPTWPEPEAPVIDLKYHGADAAIITPDRIEAYRWDKEKKDHVLMWERER